MKGFSAASLWGEKIWWIIQQQENSQPQKMLLSWTNTKVTFIDFGTHFLLLMYLFPFFFSLPSDKSRVWKWLWELQLYCFQRAGHRIQGVPAHSGRSALAFGWFISVNAFKWMQRQRSFKSTSVVCKITKKTRHSWPSKPRLNHIKPKPSTRIWDFPEQYLFWRLNHLTNTK